MCKIQYLFLLVATTIGATRSWDIALTVGDQLEFYSNQTKVSSEGSSFKDLTALAYDVVNNMLLFVDKQGDNTSIFSYDMPTKNYRSWVGKKSKENIQGVAFDPVTSTIFWTDTIERSIFSKSLKPGSKNSMFGNLVIRMDNEIPRAIAVDSCRGYIYWTNTNVSAPTIERSRFDGTEKTVIVDTNIFLPVSLAIDQQTKRIYWTDDKEGIHYSIESADLDGKNRITMLSGEHHEPNSISISKHSIFWVDWGYKTVWSIPKIPSKHAQPKPYVVFDSTSIPFSVVTNYKIEDQIKGTTECKNLEHLLKNVTPINDTFTVSDEDSLGCVHGVEVVGKYVCECNPGYTGDRCDISVCLNYCYQGFCTVTSIGEPTCRCNKGSTGKRCETEKCYNYCLNNGLCEIDENSEPICSCSRDFEGSRCETLKPIQVTPNPPPVPVVANTTKEELSIPATNITCNCEKEENSTKTANNYAPENFSDGEFIMPSTCSDEMDNFINPGIIVLGITSGLLSVACLVLITRIMQLKKRPRIKKRIIVNKNVTPMTARPDQCEITIENCCNMNICETPCFEPRSTIRPNILKTKLGKDEKKNLISNMECPDDY